MTDMVNHPSHYTQYPHEVIELTSLCGFCLGNAIKYILRADFKGRRGEDLKKAAWYVNYMCGMSAEIIKDQIRSGVSGEEWFDSLVKSYSVPLVEQLIFACVAGSRCELESVRDALLSVAEGAK